MGSEIAIEKKIFAAVMQAEALKLAIRPKPTPRKSYGFEAFCERLILGRKSKVYDAS